KGQISQNTYLTASVVAFDISCGIFFRIAVELCLLERILKGHTVMNHLGQDIVCCTVENTANLVELIGGQTLQLRADVRDAAADRILKHLVVALFLSNTERILAAGGDRLLIRGANALAIQHAATRKLISGAHAAHDLGHNRDLWI